MDTARRVLELLFRGAENAANGVVRDVRWGRGGPQNGTRYFSNEVDGAKYNMIIEKRSFGVDGEC
jgi:hypothetical protein